MFLIKSNIPTIASVRPYTPLELQGRDIYIREGCYNCHSQLIRPFRSEVERYGEYSKSGEFVYDHPFQWGSKRTGPDLAREGVKGGKIYKPDSWHYEHFVNPQKTNIQSIMPPYPWLAKNDLDIASTPKKIRAMQKLGVPYPTGYDEMAIDDLKKQAIEIANGLMSSGIEVEYQKEIIAMIAYMQRLGTDINKDVP
jgi:cytochrome c oxidase cbb3-type subunit I/II